MEKPKSIPSNALATISELPDSSTEELVRQRVSRLAELIRKDGAPYPLTSALVNIWVDVFIRAGVLPSQVDAVFDEAEKRLKFWPAPAEVLGFILTAEQISGEEKASQKWNEVRRNIRLHYHPDLGAWRGPRIVEHTQRAINAAGGMAHISECIGDDLVFARKRFLESYLRWDELKQDEYLLPAGKVKNLLVETATTMSVERLLGAPKGIEPDVWP